VGRRGDGEGWDNETQTLTPPGTPTPSACSCCPWVGPGLGGRVPCRQLVEPSQTNGWSWCDGGGRDRVCFLDPGPRRCQNLAHGPPDGDSS